MQMSPLGAVIRGAITGAVGTVALDATLFVRCRTQGGEGGRGE